MTVRRDVTELADRGLLARVHGGVTLVRPRSSQPERGSPGALVGMVAPSVDYYWPQVIQGAQSTVAGAGGRLVLRASRYDAAEDRRQVGMLIERGVQTVLVAPATGGRGALELLRWLGSLAVPVILVERVPPPELPTLALDAVTTAHGLGAGLAVRHLVSLGHRRVGLVTVPVQSDQSCTVGRLARDDRVAGPGCWYGTGFRCPGLWLTGLGAGCMTGVLDRCRREEIHALLVHSDREAIGLIERARDGGIAVPGELAVVSYDDEVAAVSDPPLTAVRPQKHRLGALAAELALARLADNADRPVHRVQLWPTLVVRESCGGLGVRL